MQGVASQSCGGENESGTPSREHQERESEFVLMGEIISPFSNGC